MTIDISRRDFMKIIFGTTAAAVLPAIDLWPEDTRALPKEALPVAKPYEFLLDKYGYLVDPSFAWEDDWPTAREYLGYDTLTLNEKVEVFEDQHGIDELLEYVDKALSQWNEDDLAILESIDRDWLDEPLDPEFMGDYQAARYTEYWPGIEVYESIGVQETDAIGLWLVQGDHPGSSFCGVRFDGNLDDLNSALSTAKLNMVVARGT